MNHAGVASALTLHCRTLRSLVIAVLQFGEGYLFAERYVVHSLLGTGGMGAVYSAEDLQLECSCALKVMLPNVLGSSELRERFAREARIGSRLDCDHVVAVLDAGIDEATQLPYLVMELLHGEDLSKRLQRLGRFSASEVVLALHQTALALSKSHALQIIHRDLKPENLFCVEREDGRYQIKVLDFGIAKLLEEGGSLNTSVLGTPAYMAPEQLDATYSVSNRTDIYALGMVAYTLLTGHRYWQEEFNGANVFAFAAIARHGPKECASTRAARQGVELPKTFDNWFARATCLDQEERFNSACDAVSELTKALGVQPHFEAVQLPREKPRKRAPRSGKPPEVTEATATFRVQDATANLGRSFRNYALGIVVGAGALIGITSYVVSPHSILRERTVSSSTAASLASQVEAVGSPSAPRHVPATAPPPIASQNSVPQRTIQRAGSEPSNTAIRRASPAIQSSSVRRSLPEARRIAPNKLYSRD